MQNNLRSYALTAPVKGIVQPNENMKKMMIGMALMATLFCVGYSTDVPISCITDTICLPYDFWVCTGKESDRQKTKVNQRWTRPLCP